MISANITFQILLCHSPVLLFTFRILLFPFEVCYSFFWIYYAIMNSFIQFPILSFAFELCVLQFSIVQSSHAVSNPIISFQILLFSLPILLCHYAFFYSVSNSIIRFRVMFFQIRDFVYLADGALGTSNKLISRVPAIQKNVADLDVDAVTESITSKHKCNFTVTWFTKFWLW